MMIEGAVDLCVRCKPESDPGGVGMHAGYAARMRTHLAEERVRRLAGFNYPGPGRGMARDHLQPTGTRVRAASGTRIVPSDTPIP